MDQAQAIQNNEKSIHERIMAALDSEEPEKRLPDSPRGQAPEEIKEQSAENEGPKEEAQPEGEAESEGKTIEIDPEDKLFEVEIVGEGGEKKTEKLSLNELKAQRMMQADYQRKTQELARQRAEVENQVRQGLQAHLQQQLQQFEALQAMVVQTALPEFRDVNWSKLSEEDPYRYVQLSNRKNEITNALQQLENQKRMAAAQIEANRQAEISKAKAEASEKVKQTINGWNEEYQSTLHKTAIDKYGFKKEELDQIFHPGFVRMLHDAHEFQKAKSGKIADKKVVVAPKSLKAGTSQPEAKNRVSEQFQKLRKSGRVEDAARAIYHMI